MSYFLLPANACLILFLSTPILLLLAKVGVGMVDSSAAAPTKRLRSPASRGLTGVLPPFSFSRTASSSSPAAKNGLLSTLPLTAGSARSESASAGAEEERTSR